MSIFQISIHNFGHFRLDGGAMFGSVPKNLWAKKVPADDQNRIKLATNCLIVSDNKRRFLIDVGMGDKWDEKTKQIFAIEPLPETKDIEPEKITDIILTHLHFDHAGGISYYDSTAQLKLRYPNANIYLQKDNFENAKHPSLKERASYLKENVDILSSAKLNLITGSQEIYPGIWVHQINGHTKGQQYVEIKNATETFLYATDLIPTSNHLPLPYHMGYDICGETVMQEKEMFLKKAIEQDATVIFEHDPDVIAGKIGFDAKGHFTLNETINIALA